LLPCGHARRSGALSTLTIGWLGGWARARAKRVGDLEREPDDRCGA